MPFNWAHGFDTSPLRWGGNQNDLLEDNEEIKGDLKERFYGNSALCEHDDFRPSKRKTNAIIDLPS
jgi:hypothetical protein